MKTLVTRTLSGAVFAAIMLLGITLHPLACIALFFLITIGCLWEYYTVVKPLYTLGRVNAETYRWFGVVLGGLMYLLFASFALQALSVGLIPARLTPLLYVLPLMFFALELYSLSPAAIRNAAINATGLLYIAVSFGLLVQMLGVSAQLFFPNGCAPVLGLLLLIWANDTFAYLGGTLIGRNKLYPEISPGKTWEGVAVGALFALLASYGLYRWLGVYEIHVWFGLALIASIVGTVGDLFESMIKRNVGIKDSGKIMPGHGGFLDRFDAFIFCIPFAYAWLRIVAT